MDSTIVTGPPTTLCITRFCLPSFFFLYFSIAFFAGAAGLLPYLKSAYPDPAGYKSRNEKY